MFASLKYVDYIEFLDANIKDGKIYNNKSITTQCII